MQKKLFVVASIAFLSLFGVVTGQRVDAKTAAEIVAGRVVSIPERPEMLWYVHPGLSAREQITDWQSVVSIASKTTKTVSIQEFDRIDSGTNPIAFNTKLRKRLSGSILLDVTTAELWYVSPGDLKRYSIRTVEDAQRIIKLLQMGISQKDADRIPESGASSSGNLKFRQRLAGRILWRVSDDTHWYVSPKNLTRYPLNTPEEIRSTLNSQLLGIAHKKIMQIPRDIEGLSVDTKITQAYKGWFLRPVFDPSQIWYVSPTTKRRVRLTEQDFFSLLSGEQTFITATGIYSIRMTGETEYLATTTTTSLGTFPTKLLTANLGLPGVGLSTLGGNAETCLDVCTSCSVGSFAAMVEGALAALNGTYFCPEGSSACTNKTNSYYSPLFHSSAKVMLNEDQIPGSNYAMLVFDSNDNVYYFRPASKFVSLEAFEATNGVKVQAAIANWPALIERGVNILDPQSLDAGQKNTKTTRVAFGVKGKTVYFLIVQQATVVDLAAVAESYGLDYAINLDGGSSTALWQYGSYLVGPGRAVPNALVVQRAFGY